jgi:hypothetical protein
MPCATNQGVRIHYEVGGDVPAVMIELGLGAAHFPQDDKAAGGNSAAPRMKVGEWRHCVIY